MRRAPAKRRGKLRRVLLGGVVLTGIAAGAGCAWYKDQVVDNPGPHMTPEAIQAVIAQELLELAWAESQSLCNGVKDNLDLCDNPRGCVLVRIDVNTVGGFVSSYDTWAFAACCRWCHRF